MEPNAEPQEPQKKRAETTPSSVETTGGVSFIIPEKKPTLSNEGGSPSRDEVRRALQESGVTTEGASTKNLTEKKEGSRANTTLRRLRTYKDDVAEALKRSKGSKVSIQAAESKRRETGRKDALKHAKEEKAGVERAAYLKQKEARLKEKKSNILVQKEQDRILSEQNIQKEKERIREERIRLAKAQRERREQQINQQPVQLEKEKSGTNIGIVITSILLLLLGSGLLYGAYSLFFVEETKSPILEIDTLIFAETNKDVITDGLLGSELIEILTQEKNALSLSQGTVVNFNLTQSIPGDIALFDTLPAALLLSRIAGNAPPSLARSVLEEYMLGVHVLSSNEPFLILKPSFYESVFADMLKWENRMMEDLAPLFGVAPSETSSTRSSSLLLRASEAPFEDKVIENQDVRVSYNARGEIILLYSFIDRKTLIITTNKTTLIEVLKRMTAKRVSR